MKTDFPSSTEVMLWNGEAGRKDDSDLGSMLNYLQKPQMVCTPQEFTEQCIIKLWFCVRIKQLGLSSPAFTFTYILDGTVSILMYLGSKHGEISPIRWAFEWKHLRRVNSKESDEYCPRL